MGRGKGASVKIKKSNVIDKDTIASMKQIFECVPERVPVYVSIEKYNIVRAEIASLAKAISYISSDYYRNIFPENTNGFVQLSIFALKLQAVLKKYPTVIGSNATIGDPKTNAETYNIYDSIKKEDIVQSTIVLCNEFKKAEAFLIKKDGVWVNINFPLTQVGPDYFIFDKTAPAFDLKLIWNSIDPQQTKIKEFYLTFFERIYAASRKIYDTLTSPDVDQKEIASVLKNALLELRNIPELADCGEIFEMVENSTDLLENNFSSYYKEADAVKDTNIILTNFISDVAESNASRIKPQTALKFKKLVAFIERHSKNKSTAQMSSIINQINSKLDQSTQLAEESSDDE